MTNKQTVLLFAGQGAQVVGMGRNLIDHFQVARDRFAQADEHLGFSLSQVMFEGPNSELTRTSRCQPALYIHGMICLEILRDLIPDLQIEGVAGLSLGEITAHAAAGTFDFCTGLDIVMKRGRFMEEATDATEGTMAAMIGGDDEKVAELARKCNIDVANYNAPGQIVVSGSREGVSKAISRAKEFGIRMAKELPVAGAYHSRLMISAGEKLARELADISVGEPKIPVVCNIDASLVSTPEEIRSTLERQVSGSVRWSDSVQKFIADGNTNFIEIGPGGILNGLMKRIDRRATICSVFDSASIDAAVRMMEDDTVAAA